MNLPTWKLGTCEEIVKALNSVQNDAWANERLYPVIAQKLAERELNDPGIHLAFLMALNDAVKADGEGRTGAANMIANLMALDIEDYVTAFKATAKTS